MFALVDCNNFYASCEEVFNPKLAGKPVLILSNNDGCVIARSKKAKELGIEMGAPAYHFKERAAQGELILLSSNFTLYADMSNRVMHTLSSFSSCQEIYSIDEAFFLLDDGTKDLVAKASAMKKQVMQWTGIPISIGIAPTKTLAKLANKMAKKRDDGVCLLTSKTEIRAILEKTRPQDIWGIGSHLAERLRKKRIYTAAEVADCDDRTLQSLLGIQGLRTALELRSICCFPYGEEPGKRQSILCSRSFGQAIQSMSELQEAIAAFATRAAEKLRDQESRAGHLSVFFATSAHSKEPYVSRSIYFQLPYPTAYTPELIRLAKLGVEQMFQSGLAYKRAGVLLADFCDAPLIQDDLFAKAEDPKKALLMQTVDKINQRYGKEAIGFAAAGIEQPWRSLQNTVSPRYTTAWAELLKVL